MQRKTRDYRIDVLETSPGVWDGKVVRTVVRRFAWDESKGIGANLNAASNHFRQQFARKYTLIVGLDY